MKNFGEAPRIRRGAKVEEDTLTDRIHSANGWCFFLEWNLVNLCFFNNIYFEHVN